MKKLEDDWEECPICMEPTNFDAVMTQYWVCCGQKMCGKCGTDYQPTRKGELKSCPFCRHPLMCANEAKYQSQLLKWCEKGKAWAQTILGDRYNRGEYYIGKHIEKAIYYLELAAAQGQHLALYNLGDLYLFGNGEQLMDYEKALHYFKLAARVVIYCLMIALRLCMRMV